MSSIGQKISTPILKQTELNTKQTIPAEANNIKSSENKNNDSINVSKIGTKGNVPATIKEHSLKLAEGGAKVGAVGGAVLGLFGMNVANSLAGAVRVLAVSAAVGAAAGGAVGGLAGVGTGTIESLTDSKATAKIVTGVAIGATLFVATAAAIAVKQPEMLKMSLPFVALESAMLGTLGGVVTDNVYSNMEK